MKGGSPLTPWLSRLLCDVGLVNSGEELVPVARNHPWIARFLLSLASLIQSHGHRCFPFLLLVLSAGPHNMETGKQRLCLGSLLGVQRLRLCASTAGGMGSIPGWGTKIPHAAQHCQKIKRKKKKHRLWHWIERRSQPGAGPPTHLSPARGAPVKGVGRDLVLGKLV